MELSDKDIDRLAAALAPILVKHVQETHHEFWIDPESHYNSHRDLTDMTSDYKKAKGIFWTVFLTAIAVAAILSAGWALFLGKK